MTRRLNIWLFLILLAISIPYYWYLVDTGAGPGAAEPREKSITMAQLRALAAAPADQRPVELQVETVGMRFSSGNMLAAGTGLRSAPNVVRAYRLIMPQRGAVIIDAGISPQMAQDYELKQFNKASQARVENAIAEAGGAVLLSHGPGHVGGHKHTILNAEKNARSLHPEPQVLAPGVVLIPARGLTQGMGMIYAKLENGREFLFAGDVSKLDASWLEMRPPARLASRAEPANFRAESLSWLMTINALHRAAPNMIIVSGHGPRPVPFSVGTFSD